MSDTANIRIYRVRENVDISYIIAFLTDELGYNRIEFYEPIQRTNRVEIWLYARSNKSVPDWVDLLKGYLPTPNPFKGFLKYDFIMLIQCKSSNGQMHTFAFCGGAGYYDVMHYFDYTFGISVLEAVFDPKLNKLAAVSEKGIIGDVLASHRFYRRARPIAYEDDFGKYFQTIDVRLRDSQIKEKFPRLASKKEKDLKPMISISGSSSVEIRMRINFYELVLLLKDLAELMVIQHPPIFNKTLMPLDINRDKDKILELNEKVFDDIINYCLRPDEHPMDIDFCHRDFEAFYASNCCQFTIQNLSSTDSDGNKTMQVDDAYSFDDLSYIRKIFEIIESDHAYDQTTDGISFAKDVFKSMHVVTRDDQDRITTSGKFLEYLQREVQNGGISYFLLDNRWYRLHSEFDSVLTSRYTGRVSDKFKDHPFIQDWNGPEEIDYNKLYNDPPNSLYLHLIKVDNVELCDALIFDMPKKRAYFIHVKDGIGATTRDLTSQVHMAARIIEEEARSQDKTKLAKLYDQSLNNNRINSQSMTKDQFLRRITTFDREYVLAIHDSTKSPRDIQAGNLESRIAKFSLVEFASAMRMNDCDFSISCIGS